MSEEVRVAWVVKDLPELAEHIDDALELSKAGMSIQLFVRHLPNIDWSSLERRCESKLDALTFSDYESTFLLLTSILRRESRFDTAIVPSRFIRFVLRAKVKKIFLKFDKRKILNFSGSL